MIKSQKGITLVALIITIIVMLILAGVSISLVLDEKGVLSKAQEVEPAQIKGALRDAVQLANADMIAAYYAESEKGYDDGKNPTLESDVAAYVNANFQYADTHEVSISDNKLTAGEYSFNVTLDSPKGYYRITLGTEIK